LAIATEPNVVCGDSVLYSAEWIADSASSEYLEVKYVVGSDPYAADSNAYGILTIQVGIQYYVNVMLLGIGGVPPDAENLSTSVVFSGTTPSSITTPPPPTPPPPVQILIPDSNVLDLSYGIIGNSDPLDPSVFQILLIVPYANKDDAISKLDAWSTVQQTTTLLIGNIPISNVQVLSYEQYIVDENTPVQFVVLLCNDVTQPIPSYSGGSGYSAYSGYSGYSG
jgi:hypothetical protein